MSFFPQSSTSELLEEGERIIASDSEHDHEGSVREARVPRRTNRATLLATAGGAMALASFAVAGSSMVGRSRAQQARVMDSVVEAGAFEPCDPNEVPCPLEWFTSSTGGYYCRSSGGCSPWSEEGGEFPKEACDDQCSVGNTPAHASVAAPAPPPPPAALPDAALPPAGPSPGAAGATKPAPPSKDPNEIQPCDDDETLSCPDDWVSGDHGGYLCRETSGCSPWTKDGGSFPKEVCNDQCTIGFTPSTRTTTSTSTFTTTITITSTYPGMGISLFCWSLAMPGYEFDILRRQKEMYAGIFACNDQIVLSFSKETIQVGADKIETWTCEKVESGVSKDGTSANTLQFMKAWEVIQSSGKYKEHDWTVKVDPDAVLLPDRLRIHLNPTNGGNVYVRNCNKPMAEGTMMFGALEAISRTAMEGYYANFDACNNEVPWQAWGEDLFMMRCLEHIGVGIWEDFSIIQDGVCNGVWCGDNFAAAFHPMKDVPSWEGCWNAAVAAR
jgi:hypothetical protein